MSNDILKCGASPDPNIHRERMRQRLEDLIGHARADLRRVDEPRFQSLLATTAEVLGGLKTAFEHYEPKAEGPWASGRHRKMKFAPPQI